MTDIPVIDLYAALDHKAGMGENASSGLDASLPYIPEQDRRRMNAYYRLAAYLENVARIHVVPDDGEPDETANRREFGDARMFIDQIAGAVLGIGPQIVVDGADTALPDLPDLPAAPPEPAEGLPEIEAAAAQLVYDAAAEEYAARVEQIVERWKELAARQPELLESQDWLREWADADQYIAKITEMEHTTTVPLGDGIMEHSWNAEAGRPETTIYHPEAYVPIWDPGSRSEFPNRVHLVWPETEEVDGEETQVVRRMTWELVPVDGEDADPSIDRGPALKYLTDSQTQTETCLFSHGVWLADGLEDIDDPPSPMRWETMDTGTGEPVPVERVPLGLDFIPIVHFTHSLARLEEFGRSPLLATIQLLDEIHASDTGQAYASRLAERPPLVLSDLKPGTTEVKIAPNIGFGIGPQGKAYPLPMAQELKILLERELQQLSRLAAVFRVPEGLVGRIKPDQVPSGISLRLSFTSFEQSTERARMARAQKYRLSQKMIQRIAIQNDAEGITEVAPARLEFGTFMPQDLAGDAAVIQLLHEAKAISVETGVVMAKAAGAPIEDVQAEVTAIVARWGDFLDQLTAATEDPRYAVDQAGLPTLSDGGEDDAPLDTETADLAGAPVGGLLG